MRRGFFHSKHFRKCIISTLVELQVLPIKVNKQEELERGFESQNLVSNPQLIGRAFLHFCLLLFGSKNKEYPEPTDRCLWLWWWCLHACECGVWEEGSFWFPVASERLLRAESRFSPRQWEQQQWGCLLRHFPKCRLFPLYFLFPHPMSWTLDVECGPPHEKSHERTTETSFSPGKRKLDTWMISWRGASYILWLPL